MNRYWLSNGDGQTFGPYTIEDLRGFAAQGRVRTTSTLCQEGTAVWLPATQVLGPLPGASVSGGGVQSGSWTPVSLVGPILATLFCCLPCGIASIVYASSANTKAALGDMQGAMQAQASARLWLRLAVIPGAILFILYFIGAIIFGALSRS